MSIILPGSDDAGLSVAPPVPALSLGRAFEKPDHLAPAARGGFSVVELDASDAALADPERRVGLARSELIRALHEHDLTVASVIRPAPLCAASKRERNAGRDRLRSVVDMAADTGATLATIRLSGAADDGPDAARRALDLLWAVETEATRAGVRLAVEDGPDVVLAGDPERRRVLLADLPECVGLALRASDGADAVRPLVGRTALLSVGARIDPEDGPGLNNADTAAAVLGALSEKDWSGALPVRARGAVPDADVLAALHRMLARFVPEAFIAGAAP